MLFYYVAVICTQPLNIGKGVVAKGNVTHICNFYTAPTLFFPTTMSFCVAKANEAESLKANNISVIDNIYTEV